MLRGRLVILWGSPENVPISEKIKGKMGSILSVAPMLLYCRTLYRYVLCDAYAADRKSGSGGGEGGSTPRDTCRASLKLAPKRRPKFPVPLYIPYFFMGVRLIVRITQLKQTMAAVIC